MLNCECYIAILETIEVCTKKSSGSFKNVIYKMCLQIVCVCVYIYIYIYIFNPVNPG